MAKARAIVKRRRAVRNIRKITKTMQMIATARFQQSLRRAVGTKPYSTKVRELVRELAANVGEVDHPLLRQPDEETRTHRIAVIVIASNRGLAGAYNGSILRTASAFIREQESEGKTVDLYVAGKKGVSYFNFQKRPITQRYDQFADQPRYDDVSTIAQHFIDQFTAGQIDALHVAYMNFISTGVQRPDVLTLLPLAGVKEVVEHLAQQTAETRVAAERAEQMDPTGTATVASYESGTGGRAVQAEPHQYDTTTTYDFSPEPHVLLDELLPLTLKTALFQCFLDAATSEHVARMVAMKSATDNADDMVKTLTMQYNRARQSQITTELSEIMGGVEAMKTR